MGHDTAETACRIGWCVPELGHQVTAVVSVGASQKRMQRRSWACVALRGSCPTLLAEMALTEELILQWAKDKIIMSNFMDFDLEAEITEPLPLAYLDQTVAQL